MADIDEAPLARAQQALGRVRLATIASAPDTPAECARVIESAGAPVYALGGITPRNAMTLRGLGFAGIAAVSALA